MSLDVRSNPSPSSVPSQTPGNGSPGVLPAMDRSNREPASTSGGKWWKRGIALVLAVAVIATGVTFLSGANKKKETGPRLTHVVKKGDLRVTVVEQGTLESSSNTEIKCRVKGGSTVLWVIEAGTEVKPGDVVVRLDQSSIEDTINQQKITYQTALATHTQSETAVAVAAIAVTEYEEGTFKSALQLLEKDLAVAQSNLRTTQNLLQHSQRMFRKGYISGLEVEGNEFSHRQAKLELALKQTDIDVLKKFTKAKMLEELRSTLKSAKAKLKSDKAALDLEKSRLERAEQQLKNCVIKAEAPGMVIHPSAAEWKSAPDIEEGANVREDQVLLIIPDLTQMQVKVGIHESKVDRLRVGMESFIELRDERLDGEVATIATVTKPAGWWTGNVVKYDTIIKIDQTEGLKPGMSAAVEVVLAEYTNVLTVPVAAVVDQEGAFLCWVKNEEGEPEKRALSLGDTDEQFIIVKSGLKEGDELILNPLAFVEEAKAKALRPIQTKASPTKGKKPGKGKGRKPVKGKKPGKGKPAGKGKKSGSGKTAGKGQKPAGGKPSGKPAGKPAKKAKPPQKPKPAPK